MANWFRSVFNVVCVVNVCSVHAVDLIDSTWVVIVPGQKCIKKGVVDITVEMQFSANVATNTKAYALVVSYRRLKQQSNGKKMNVLY